MGEVNASMATINDQISRKVAQILLEQGAVSFSVDKMYTFASGITSPIYCDNRVLLSNPTIRGSIRHYLIERLHQNSLLPDAICGIATAGIPWAAIMADHFDLPLVYARSASKAHGTRKQLEGKITPGSSVLVVDDLITTGASCLNGVSIVRDAGSIVDACLCIFWYELPQASRAFEEARCRLIPATGLSILLEEARASDWITANQEALIRSWARENR